MFSLPMGMGDQWGQERSKDNHYKHGQDGDEENEKGDENETGSKCEMEILDGVEGVQPR